MPTNKPSRNPRNRRNSGRNDRQGDHRQPLLLPSATSPGRRGANKSDESGLGWLLNLENIVTIAVALLLAFIMRTFVVEARWIPSESMVPTLEIYDRLAVEKISYRFGPPHRGDIVVFTPPAHLNITDAYIKRVVGIPGDTLEIRLGEGVYVNGQLLEEDYVAEPPLAGFSYREDLVELGDISAFPLEEGLTETDPIVVPPEHYFVMGDNRNNSQDSHVWGFLPRENIIGRTFVRFWPIGRWRYFPQERYPELAQPSQQETGEISFLPHLE